MLAVKSVQHQMLLGITELGGSVSNQAQGYIPWSPAETWVTLGRDLMKATSPTLGTGRHWVRVT